MIRQIPVKRDCDRCGRVDFTAAVSVIVVWVHGLNAAVPMIPEDELRLCASGRCGAAYRLVCREFGAHPRTRLAIGEWTRALIVFEDGDGIEIRNTSARELACA
jgi:hypothetical protein